MARAVIVADTGPINYLVLIGCIDLLPSLFETVILPVVVYAELSASKAPQAVHSWIAALPLWLEIHETPVDLETDLALKGMHLGEQAAISLAIQLKADLLLMDDRKGVTAARGKGLRVTGTLGILELAARNGLIHLPQVIERLSETNFRAPRKLLDALAEKYS